MWLLFLCLFLLSLSTPCANRASQEGCVFRSLDIPLFYFHGIFPILSFSQHHSGLLFPILTTKHCYKMFWLGNTQFTSVQLLSSVQLFPSPWTAAHQASLSITNSQMSFQTHVHWVGDAIQPSHPLSSLMLPPSIFPSITVFSNESVFHIRWPKHWSFRISPSNKYSGLIYFRIEWFDLSIQVTLESLLQHHSSKASIVRCSAFFIPQLSHPYLTTGKAIALTRQIFVGKVMSRF